MFGGLVNINAAVPCVWMHSAIAELLFCSRDTDRPARTAFLRYWNDVTDYLLCETCFERSFTKIKNKLRIYFCVL